MVAKVDSGASASTILAVDRTRLAHDRTLMAWVRTATSLISFGFTIYKFFQYIRQQNPEHLEPVLNPRRFALVLISLGILSLAIATWQHQRDMVRLRAQYPEVPYSLATVLAGLIALFGVLALLAVVLRI